ncbi:MAG: glucosaminidase domain-containing protein [Prevotella sp.]|jgi:LysM repeat protein|nr:glucosaminidase domain-containing protein [Prevotella sp.]MCI1247224.1 glucosaminidase domain-containing protein [Prevotella sp.]
MKKIFSLLLMMVLVIPTGAQLRWNSQFQNYINQYKDLAIEQMLRYHIPASITLAQGVLESRGGLSSLVTEGNNHFGIKCHNWTGPTQYHDDDAKGECFRVYSNARESYEDHSKFLHDQPRYASLFRLDITDYRGWAKGLRDCGYATNPNYANLLIQIIELYSLNQYDKDRHYDHFMAQHSGKDQLVQSELQLHPIHRFNNNYYLFAREGDTFKSIGKEVDISWKKLAKYNERDKNDILHKGDIVFLKKKEKKAPKQFKDRPHVVKPGESMYSIAQAYGMRLENLYKLNSLSPTYQIYPGAKLRVR